MNQLPDRCPAVDQDTARRCMLNENHDGPHTDWAGGTFSPDGEPTLTPLTAGLRSLTEAVLAHLDVAGVDRFDQPAAIACLGKTTVPPVSTIAIYIDWFNHQNVTR